MKPLCIFSRSAEDTRLLGEQIGRRLPGGAVVVLLGDIGAGKTCIARGICVGAGMIGDASFSSPSFTLMNSYPSHRLSLHHFDFYRLRSAGEVHDIGFWDWIDDRSIVLIEWPEYVLAELPEPKLVIQLQFGGNPDERRITVEASAESLAQLMEELEHADPGD